MSTDRRQEYPQYYHVEDVYGNVHAVMCVSAPTKFTVVSYRGYFAVAYFSNEVDAKQFAPGQVLGCSADDFAKVLFDEWHFDIDHDIMSTQTKEEADEPVISEPSEPEPATELEDSGDDPGEAGTVDEAPEPEPTDDTGSDPETLQPDESSGDASEGQAEDEEEQPGDLAA